MVEHYQKSGSIYFKLYHDRLGEDVVMAIFSALLEHDMVRAHDLVRLKNIKKQY
ncbi:hypothetical protein [Bartonella koehlerae]|uniref:hypothetical protein n=1 Tax=Bartonella koehlerae TaxID=92181 RepID=UPI003CCF9FD1